MATVLITGASRGIGLELVRQYSAGGWRVLACCRHPDVAEPLATITGTVERYRLNVIDDRDVAALRKRLDGQPIDVLINNAGIRIGAQDFGSTDVEQWLEVMHVNCVAPVRVCEALAENVAASSQRKMIAITSRLGSIGDGPDGGDYAYRTSKAALNMAMVNAAAELGQRGIAVGLIHPGWVRTDMGGPEAPVGVDASVAGVRRVIDALDLSSTGGFWDYQGNALPW